MAYIPTIHTFEDDINENRGANSAQSNIGIESIVSNNNILVQEKPKSSPIKIFITFFSVILFLGAIGVVGYYYYSDYQNKQAEALLNAQSLAKEQEKKAREEASIVNNLQSIFPSLAEDMGKYVDSAVKKDNIIIITIKDNQSNNLDNYSQLYAYILAHQKDLGKDLVETFNLNQIVENTQEEPITKIEDNNTTTDLEPTSTLKNNLNNSNKKEVGNKKTDPKSKTNSSSTLENVVNLFDPKSLQNNFSTLITDMSKPTPISGEELIWENKTLNNQDFEIANAGVVTLLYGYVKQNYLVFSISLKDFFDTIKGLQ